MLTDAGPLIALIDADEPDHLRCMETLDLVRLPLLTTWPAFTEERGITRTFDLDADFHVYRLKGRRPFGVVPAYRTHRAASIAATWPIPNAGSIPTPSPSTPDDRHAPPTRR